MPPSDTAPSAPPPAHRVSGEFTLSGGSPSDYDQAARASIKGVLAEAAGVSADAVSLTLTAGSVVVSYEIIVADATAAATSRDSLVAGPLATPAALQTALVDRFAADGVVSAPAVEVQALTPPQAVSVATGDSQSGSVDTAVLIAIIAGGSGAFMAILCITLFCRKKGPPATALMHKHPNKSMGEVRNGSAGALAPQFQESKKTSSINKVSV